MRQYDTSNLIVHPGNAADPDVIVEVTPELAGWDYIHFQVRRLQRGADLGVRHRRARAGAGVAERQHRRSSRNRGHWPRVGERKDVFAGRRRRCTCRGAPP